MEELQNICPVGQGIVVSSCFSNMPTPISVFMAEFRWLTIDSEERGLFRVRQTYNRMVRPGSWNPVSHNDYQIQTWKARI